MLEVSEKCMALENMNINKLNKTSDEMKAIKHF